MEVKRGFRFVLVVFVVLLFAGSSLAIPRAALVDSDGDGFMDRAEKQLGSDPFDITSFPKTTVRDFTVAFIGDQGMGDDAEAVLQLIEDEGTDMILHQGDFDYDDDPEAWDAMITDILGEDFPLFASIGNHDVVAWDGYQDVLQARLDRVEGASCTGDLGINSACTYKGLFFILSGVDIMGEDHDIYIKEELAKTDALWRVCSWHKVQELMQVGGKGNEAGWEVYEECRKGGAIVATAHEHLYSRTHLMANFETQEIASTDNTLVLTEGESFAFVSGLGGKSIRESEPELASNEWWASVYSADEGASDGALFCTFNYEKVNDQAYCYFKDTNGVIADSFYLISNVNEEVVIDEPEEEDVIQIVERKADEYGLPQWFLKSVVHRESTFNPELINYDDGIEGDDNWNHQNVDCAVTSDGYPHGVGLTQLTGWMYQGMLYPYCLDNPDQSNSDYYYSMNMQTYGEWVDMNEVSPMDDPFDAEQNLDRYATGYAVPAFELWSSVYPEESEEEILRRVAYHWRYGMYSDYDPDASYLELYDEYVELYN